MIHLRRRRASYAIVLFCVTVICAFVGRMIVKQAVDTDRVGYDAPRCEEHRQVAFLKVHKAGSSTVMNVLQRFGEKRRLIFVLPKVANYLGNHRTIIDTNLILKPPKNKSYDMLFNHVIYSRESFREVMPNGTKYVAIVRQPFNQFVSAIRYYRKAIKYLSHIPGPDVVTSYLKHPSKYEPQNPMYSFTRNSMSYDFGLKRKHYYDIRFVKQFVQNIMSDFDLVMIMEYFDESLVMLKRMLCWEIKDILYIRKNLNLHTSSTNYTLEQRAIHRTSSSADYYLYETALSIFKTALMNTTHTLVDEVNYFKRVVSVVKYYCNEKIYLTRDLTLEASVWNAEFKVTKYDCKFMKASELWFVDYSRSRHVQK